jgi:excisionase family DNA binding protein
VIPELSGKLIHVEDVIAALASDYYMPKRAAAQYLGMSLRTLQSQLGQMPHYRRGGKILFKRSELDRWMQLYRESSSSLDEMIEIAARDLVSGWKSSRQSTRHVQPDQKEFTRDQFERAKPFLSKSLRKKLEARFAATGEKHGSESDNA